MSSYNLGKVAGMQRFLRAKVTRIHRETIPSSAFLFGRTVRGSSVDFCFAFRFLFTSGLPSSQNPKPSRVDGSAPFPHLAKQNKLLFFPKLTIPVVSGQSCPPYIPQSTVEYPFLPTSSPITFFFLILACPLCLNVTFATT